MSPAMAAGVTDRLCEDLVALWEAYEQREGGKTGSVSEYPTLWGWITIACAVPLLMSIVWRVRFTPSSNLLRKIVSVAIALFVLPFLFSFMQCASWYK
jgi:hypothetical protein